MGSFYEFRFINLLIRLRSIVGGKGHYGPLPHTAQKYPMKFAKKMPIKNYNDARIESCKNKEFLLCNK